MELKNLFFFVFFPELSEIFAKVTMLRKYNQCEYEEQFVLIEVIFVKADCFFVACIQKTDTTERFFIFDELKLHDTVITLMEN